MNNIIVGLLLILLPYLMGMIIIPKTILWLKQEEYFNEIFGFVMLTMIFYAVALCIGISCFD